MLATKAKSFEVIALTEKQESVVRLIGEDYGYKQIALVLKISEAMVRDHAKAAAKKLPKPHLPVKARILDWAITHGRKAA